MKKLIAVMLAMVFLCVSAAGLAEETGSEEMVYDYLIPGYFADLFNADMYDVAEYYRAMLGDETADLLQSKYVFTVMDTEELNADPKGTILYIGNDDWTMEAGFTYTGEFESLDQPALMMNLSFRDEVPAEAVIYGTLIFQFIILDKYEENAQLEMEMDTWFKTVSDPGSIMELPDGYTLNFMKIEGQTTYAVLPPDGQNPYAP